MATKTQSPSLDEIIADLEAGRSYSAESQMVEKVASAPETQGNTELDDLRKLASSIDEQGRELARSFVDELNKLSNLNKIAVGVSEMTPNTAAVPANPAVQVSTDEAHLQDTAQVDAIIKKLTLGGEQKMSPAGVIHENNQPVAGTQPIAVDEHPVAADVKKANAEIIEALFAKYYA